jgi:hypothetical protein
LTDSHPTRRLAAILALALSLAAATAALLGPSQTLAQTHRSSCASAHAKARCNARTCAQSAHKGRGRHTARCHTNRASAKKAPKTSRQALALAYCEGGGAPVQAEDGSFSCEDGAQPQCENGAIPTPRGKSLVCPVIFSEETSSGQAECEEEGAGSACASSGSGSGEQACEESSGERPQCEAAG